MSPITIGIIGMIALIALMAYGMPVGFAMAIVGFAGLAVLIDPLAAITKLATTPFGYVASYDYAVVPMFILMANIIVVSGLGANLFNIAEKFLGRFSGGMAMATTGGCAGFAAISGSSLTTSLTIGAAALPELKKYKYDMDFAGATIAASGTLGLLIPPSTALMLYGIVTGNSIKDLFLAGYIPGIQQALLYLLVIYVLTRRNPALGPCGPKYTFKEQMASLKEGGEIILLITFVIVGLFLGWFTATEAGAVGTAGALLIVLLRKRLTWEGFLKAISDTIRVSGMYYVIIIGAQLFMNFTTVTTLPTLLAQAIQGSGLSPIMVVILIVIIYLFLGMFINGTAMMLLTLPIFYPLIIDLGFNPIWFGILATRVSETGLLTPPVGLGVYSIKAIMPDVNLGRVFKYSMCFVVSDLIHAALLIAFPIFATWLPAIAR